MPEAPDVFSKDPEVLERVVAEQRGVLRELSGQHTWETEEVRAGALWKLGQALHRLRRFSDALGPLEEAEHTAKLLPGWEPVWVGSRCARASALLNLKRYAEVADLTEEFVKPGAVLTKPDYLQAGLHVRALALKALDRWQEADVTASVLRERLPDEPTAGTLKHLRHALLIQAWAAQEAGDPDRGLPLADEAIALASKEQDREPLSRALTQRAELLYVAGRNAEAREALQTVIDTFRADPEDFAISAVAIARGLKLRWRLQPRRRRSA